MKVAMYNGQKCEVEWSLNVVKIFHNNNNKKAITECKSITKIDGQIT